MTDIVGWNTVARDPLVLVREYSFGAGMANALAVALPDRKWMLVSPPIGVAAAELRSLGGVDVTRRVLRRRPRQASDLAILPER